MAFQKITHPSFQSQDNQEGVDVKEQPTSPIEDALKGINEGWLSLWRLSELMLKPEVRDDTNTDFAFYAYLIKTASKDIGENLEHLRELLKVGE